MNIIHYRTDQLSALPGEITQLKFYVYFPISKIKSLEILILIVRQKLGYNPHRFPSKISPHLSITPSLRGRLLRKPASNRAVFFQAVEEFPSTVIGIVPSFPGYQYFILSPFDARIVRSVYEVHRISKSCGVFLQFSGYSIQALMDFTWVR